MDLKEALSGETEYAIKFRGFVLYFTLRDPTNAEDLEYRRRSGKISVKHKNIETSDQALDAPLWLLEQIKTKVQYSNGSAERFDVAADLYKQIPARTKFAVISKHLADLEGEEFEKNV